MFKSPKVPDFLKTPSLSPKEVAKEIDSFYSEGTNGPIPIPYALHYVVRKAAGDTPAQLQEVMAS